MEALHVLSASGLGFLSLSRGIYFSFARKPSQSRRLLSSKIPNGPIMCAVSCRYVLIVLHSFDSCFVRFFDRLTIYIAVECALDLVAGGGE